MVEYYQHNLVNLFDYLRSLLQSAPFKLEHTVFIQAVGCAFTLQLPIAATIYYYIRQ